MPPRDEEKWIKLNLIKNELKKLIDLHMSEVGFDADDKGPELLEPKSKFQALTLKLEKRLELVEEKLKEEKVPLKKKE